MPEEVLYVYIEEDFLGRSMQLIVIYEKKFLEVEGRSLNVFGRTS